MPPSLPVEKWAYTAYKLILPAKMRGFIKKNPLPAPKEVLFSVFEGKMKCEAGLKLNETVRLSVDEMLRLRENYNGPTLLIPHHQTVPDLMVLVVYSVSTPLEFFLSELNLDMNGINPSAHQVTLEGAIQTPIFLKSSQINIFGIKCAGYEERGCTPSCIFFSREFIEDSAEK